MKCVYESRQAGSPVRGWVQESSGGSLSQGMVSREEPWEALLGRTAPRLVGVSAVRDTVSLMVTLCDLAVLQSPFLAFPGTVLHFSRPGAPVYLQLSSTNSSQRKRLNRFNVLSNKLFPSSFTHILKDNVYFFSLFLPFITSLFLLSAGQQIFIVSSQQLSKLCGI